MKRWEWVEKAPIDELALPPRQKEIAVLLLNEGRPLYVREIGRELNMTRSTARAALLALERKAAVRSIEG